MGRGGKYHGLGASTTETMHFLAVLEAGSPRSGLQSMWVLVGTVFLACTLAPSFCDRVEGRARAGYLESLLLRLLIPADLSPTLINPRDLLKAPSSNTIALGLGLQHEDLGVGRKHLVHFSVHRRRAGGEGCLRERAEDEAGWFPAFQEARGVGGRRSMEDLLWSAWFWSDRAAPGLMLRQCACVGGSRDQWVRSCA